ncbi:MAG: hypothetical protein OXH70_21000 [Acidobacteria bacterium]|nr:hypothetical protein [Acidobacteriota bacterium]
MGDVVDLEFDGGLLTGRDGDRLAGQADGRDLDHQQIASWRYGGEGEGPVLGQRGAQREFRESGGSQGDPLVAVGMQLTGDRAGVLGGRGGEKNQGAERDSEKRRPDWPGRDGPGSGAKRVWWQGPAVGGSQGWVHEGRSSDR